MGDLLKSKSVGCSRCWLLHSHWKVFWRTFSFNNKPHLRFSASCWLRFAMASNNPGIAELNQVAVPSGPSEAMLLLEQFWPKVSENIGSINIVRFYYSFCIVWLAELLLVSSLSTSMRKVTFLVNLLHVSSSLDIMLFVKCTLDVVVLFSTVILKHKSCRLRGLRR